MSPSPTNSMQYSEAYFTSDITLSGNEDRGFPHYWPFEREIPWSPVVARINGPIMWSFDVLFVVNFNRLLNKQLSCQWFQIPWCSCDVTVMCYHDVLLLCVIIFTLELYSILPHLCYVLCGCMWFTWVTWHYPPDYPNMAARLHYLWNAHWY